MVGYRARRTMDASDPFYRKLVNLYDSMDQAMRAAEHRPRDTLLVVTPA